MKQKNNRSAGHVSWSNGPRFTARVAAASNADVLTRIVERLSVVVQRSSSYRRCTSYDKQRRLILSKLSTSSPSS